MVRSMTSALALTALISISNAALAAGAIAVDDSVGTKASEAGYGVGSGSTREKAAADAVAQCKKAGNDSCEIAVRYDMCGAYAASTEYAGIGWGKSEADARKKALEDCGDSACKVVVSDCSE